MTMWKVICFLDIKEDFNSLLEVNVLCALYSVIAVSRKHVQPVKTAICFIARGPLEEAQYKQVYNILYVII